MTEHDFSISIDLGYTITQPKLELVANAMYETGKDCLVTVSGKYIFFDFTIHAKGHFEALKEGIEAVGSIEGLLKE